jgi:hypothetical protein
MAFSLELVYVSSTVSLSNGAPYRLESLEDAGPAEVARLGQTSPDQHGLTDLGYRLQPRTFVMRVSFQDGNDIDGGVFGDNRDLLFDYFRPSRLLKLRMTRDDGEQRILECHTLSIEIDLLPENYPARLNRATITLRAANPTWYTATAKNPTYAGTAEWWTGNGAIGTANVMEYITNPTQGQAWTYTGTITGAWSVAMRSGSVPLPGAGTIVMFHAGTGEPAHLVSTKDAFIAGNSTEFYYTESGETFPAGMPAGTTNVFYTQNGGTSRIYAGTTLDASFGHDHDIAGTARRWRSDRTGSTATYWPVGFPYAAVYNIELSAAQRSALNSAMSAGSAITTGTVTAVNEGDVYAFPTITLRGPLANPVLTNVTTDDVIDLTGISVPPNSTYTLDLSDGHKTLTDINDTSLLGSMGTPVQLAGWALAPSPIATGGTNLIRVQAGSMTTETLVTVTFYDRHMSF